MLRKSTILAAVVLCNTAFMYAVLVPPGLTVPVMTGPNTVMHSKVLPNDNAVHSPYLGWIGTADADVIYAGQPVIKKGDALAGKWGGRRASATNPGFLLVTLTTVNGQSVVAGRYSQDSNGAGRDTWVASGSVISFMTCKSLNRVGGCAP